MNGQVFTVAKLHYVHGVVYETANQKTTSLEKLADLSDETTKSGNVKHPLARVRTLSRLAEGVGLLRISDKNTVEITPLGQEYTAARSEEKWGISQNQQDILGKFITSDFSRTETIYSINTLLDLCKKGYSGQKLSHKFAAEIGKKNAWKAEVTFEDNTKFVLNYLSELGLIDINEDKIIVTDPIKNGKESKKHRNPKWTRDELILALDLYFRCPPSSTNKDNPEIISLSDTLNSLPIHPKKFEYEKFRNPNGVYMKLCNFLRFDPDYSGRGLKAGGKLEEDVWNEFYPDKERLKNIAKSIIDNATEFKRPSEHEIILEDEEFEEGRILTKLHKTRERSPGLSKKKKAQVLKKTGKLACEVCGFDFQDFYGDIGQGFAECHHKKPVSELKKGEKTKVKDLSILCANCHRIIHRSKPMLTISELQKRVSPY